MAHDPTDTASIAVWDVPIPVVAGERFAIKVGAKGAAAGARVEVHDANGAVVAAGTLGDQPWPGTAGLLWASLDVPAPVRPDIARFAVRCAAAETWFSVTVAESPEHTLTVEVTERDSNVALDGVEIRLGPFQGRTDKTGHAALRVCVGVYQVQLWRTAHIAQPIPIEIKNNTSISLKMVHVPEEHPDARWVR